MEQLPLIKFKILNLRLYVLALRQFEIPAIRRGGQSLVEILLAISLASILLPALLTGLVSSREGKASQGQRLEAAALLREAEEAVRSVRESGWANISNGTYHPQISGSGTSWTLAAGSQPINGYTRQVVVSDARRDLSGQVVESGGDPDTSTKKIVSTVSWTTPFPSKVESISYFQRYLGNAAFTETTQAEFTDGAHNNTTATATGDGAVELVQLPSATVDYGNKFLVTAISGINNMTSVNHKTALRFTAQETKTVNAIRVYLQSEVGTSPNYRYGIQADSSGLPSGTYLGSGTLTATSAGWKTITLSPSVNITAGNTYHIVVQYSSGTISTSRYVALRRSLPQNLLYPKTNAVDNNSNTLFTTTGTFSAGSLQNFQPIYELDFSDTTYEGNPYESNTETAIFGSNWQAEKFTVTGGDKTPQSVSFYLRKNGSPPNALTIELRDNLNNSIYTGTVAAVSVPTSFAYITHTFTSPITLTSGQTYRVILRTTAGTNTNSYRIQIINTTNAANFNSITYDGTNSVYSTSGNSGRSWTDNNQNDIGGFYFTIPTGGSYAPSGDFTSHATGSFDAGSTAAFNNLIWNANIPANTTLQLQVAISGSPSGPFDYFGSDGAIGSYFPSSGQIPLNRINGRYLRYKATFTSNGSATPTLNEVSINYSP